MLIQLTERYQKGGGKSKGNTAKRGILHFLLSSEIGSCITINGNSWRGIYFAGNEHRSKVVGGS